jgi:hypothetical protein
MRLADGFAEEPADWRDDEGRTPLDLLADYMAARLALDRYGEADFDDSTGDLTDGDEQVLEGIKREFGRIRQAFLSPAALQRSPVVSFGGSPSWFDPAEVEISGIEAVRRGSVRIRVTQLRTVGMSHRYHVKKVDGRWKLDGLYELIEDGQRASWAGI